MKNKPTRTWHIYFTFAIAAVYVVAVYFGYMVGISPLWLVALWLFTGIVICAIVNLSEPMNVNIKIILFWLPAIWSGKVRDWVMKR